MLLMMRLPPVTAGVVLFLRGGAIVAHGGVPACLVHVLMGIRTVLLSLRLVARSVVVAATNDHLRHGWRACQECCQTKCINCPHHRLLEQLGARLTTRGGL